VLQQGRWIDEALVRIGEEEEADLVVMVTGMRTWWDRVLRASITAGFVRQSKCPVLLVRGREEPPDLNWDPTIGRILIPLDQSARSEGILEPAMSIGGLSGASYDLIHAIRPVQNSLGWSVAHEGGVIAPAVNQRAEAAKYLRSVTGRLKAQNQQARWEVVSDDRPVADTIVRYAERSGSDLIALATRGRSLLPRLILGSVAEQVVRKASMPVLLHRC
jgi:nucleotide-binding universal stress UspA family protein